MQLDPDTARHLSALGYAFAGMLALLAARGSVGDHRRRMLLAALLLGLLAGVKWFHLQLWLWEWGRTLFRQHGLYAERSYYQLFIIPALGGLAAALLCGRCLLRSGNRLLAATMLYLVLLTGLRTLSLHSMDLFFERLIAGLRVYWLLEWGGIAAAAYAISRRAIPP